MSDENLPEHSAFYEDGHSCRDGWLAVIVGKGPSIDGSVPSPLCPGPSDMGVPAVVLAINEAALRVGQWHEEVREPWRWYLVQQDYTLGDRCIPRTGVALALVNRRAAKAIEELHPMPHPGLGIFPYDPRRFGCDDSTLTAIIAVKIARLWGMTRFLFVGFDSWKDEKALGYSSVVPYPSSRPETGGATRFLMHKPLILKACEGCEVEVL
jgi:hypothetical protein